MRLKFTFLILAILSFSLGGKAQVWTFDVDGDMTGITVGTISGETQTTDEVVTIQDGILTLTWGTGSATPKFTITGLSLNASDYKNFLIRIKNNVDVPISTSNNARFVPNTSGVGNKFFNIQHDQAEEEFYTRIFDLPAAKWAGTLSSFQVQGLRGGTTGSIEIAEIRLIGPDNTWTGTVSTDWAVAGNWSEGSVPTGEIVTIPAVANQPIISNADATVADLTLENGAVLSVTNNTTLTVLSNVITSGGSGHVEVASGSSLVTYGSVEGAGHVFNRSTTFNDATGKYSVVGSPVVGASTSSLGSLVYSYDETVAYSSNRFIEVTTPETITGGDAYFSAYTGDVTFTGAPHTGNVSIPLEYDAGDGVNAGFNLVSNPYPAAISYLDLIRVDNNPDIEGTIYLWDDGGSNTEQRTNADYITVNLVGEVSSATNGSGRSGDWNGNIGSAQGFFVKSGGVSGTLNFNDEMMVVGNNASANYFRTALPAPSDIQSVKLSLTNAEGFSNQSLIGFIADASFGFDRLYDAYKVDGLNGVKLYSLMGQSPMAIQGLPIADESIIPMGIALEAAGEYTLSLDFTKNFEERKVVYLEDTELNKTINLSEAGSYSFSSTATSGANRFNLIVSSVAVLSSDDLVNRDLKVMYTRSNITISSSDLSLKNANVSVFDLSGALIFSKAINGLEGQSSVDFQFDTNKVYILRVNIAEKTLVSKIIFNN